MARDFTKNASNYVGGGSGTGVFGPLINGASAASFHFWCYPETFDTGAYDNRLLSMIVATSKAGPVMAIGDATPILKFGGRSRSADGFKAVSGSATVTTGVWHAIGAVFDFDGDYIQPYLDGSTDGGGAAAFGTSAGYEFSSVGSGYQERIGANEVDSGPTTASQFDGAIGEVAMWSVDIGDAGFSALWSGVSARLVRPESLVWLSDGVGEGNIINLLTGEALTETGTVGQREGNQLAYFGPEMMIVTPAGAPPVGGDGFSIIDRYYRQMMAA